MKALIVDDETEICMLLGYQLSKMGVDTSKAHTISDGLETYDPAEHDLIFLDINLPDGNGLDVIPVFKQKNGKVKIVVISAYDTQAEHQKAEELGAYQFLGKPFSKQRVTEIINGLRTPH